MVEPAQVADARDCCGERYLLVEQQQGVLCAAGSRTPTTPSSGR